MRADVWTIVLAALLVSGCRPDSQDTAQPTATPSVQSPVVPQEPPQASAPANAEAPKKIDTQHLPNAVRLTEKVISGGQPAGDAAFAELASLGVKTVISVDGATPDLASAHKYGLTYVHLPHGYDGVPQQRVEELAKAVRDLDGPIYIHCHHGKHRSPAAASVACVSAGMLSPDMGLNVLELAGTSPNYKGLYESAAQAQRLDDSLLDELQVEFQEVVQLPPMAEAMVEMEHLFDHLLQFQAAQWQPLVDHPDLTAAHEALLLREHYTEMLRTEDLSDQPDGFRDLVLAAEKNAQALEDILHAQNSREETDVERVDAQLAAVATDCKRCHIQFRDVPLSEKAKR